MEENLITLLETFKFPVYRQGSLAENEPYPDTFFTFWNNAEDGQAFYDDDNRAVAYDYDVNVYSADTATAYSTLRDALSLLKQNGWTITDNGHDMPSGRITHIGRGGSVGYLQTENNTI